MKKKVFLKYEFILFLYAYLRQADLSLDRSRWTAWNELKEYYRRGIEPGRVATLLLSTTGITAQSVDVKVGAATRWQKCRNFIYRNFLRKNYLTEAEILYCYRQLKVFENYLNSNLNWYTVDQEKLRVDICLMAYGIIESKLNFKDRYYAEKIEHYLQNEILTTVPLSEFSSGII